VKIGELPTYIREIAPDAAAHDALLNTEWLLTNGLGGYAMGTALGIPTRRYHGLLVAAMSPPVQREVMLSSLFETLIFNPGTPQERTVELSSYRFGDGGGGTFEHPQGWRHLVRFEKNDRCCWMYRVDDVEVEKVVHLYHERNAVAVWYIVRPRSSLVRLQLRPLLAMRDAYGLLRGGGVGVAHGGGFGEVVVHGMRDHVQVTRWGRNLEMTTDAGRFHSDPQWWYNFEYDVERRRGLDHTEDLFSPGYFSIPAGAGRQTRATISAWLGEPPPEPDDDARANRKRLIEVVNDVIGDRTGPSAGAERVALARLALASDDYIVRRRHRDVARAGISIIAGYPWFSDWGRDSMISLPGLLLCTGRFSEARRVLETFARHRRNGLIPNLFHDHSGAADYNTLDGSLWFLHAACEYLKFSGDRSGFLSLLRPACLDIIDHYRRGTDYGIRMESDGLISAGDETTQLTWMDAKRDGVVFTPRHGKAVEINALWHHGLMRIAGAIAIDDPQRSGELRQLAGTVAASFRQSFWNRQRECCFDVLTPDGSRGYVPNAQIRPNQIFAVSLEHSPLSRQQQRAVVEVVKARLLTRHGLRTLDPADPQYKGRFHGDMFERDSAYHNGTVWPWLIGPYCEALLRVSDFSPEARQEAQAALQPLLARLDGESLGQLPEIFDGDDTPGSPQQPGGCIAQAWSVAEVMRMLKTVQSEE
jgi:predicted glycogen debranching enzyme